MESRSIPNLVVCALLCLPALALHADEKLPLREELSRTANALATFANIGRGIEARDPKAVAELLSVTEAGPRDPAQAESVLLDLRTRVNALQEILDARALWAGEQAPAPLVGEVAGGPRATTLGGAPANVVPTSMQVVAPAVERIGSKIAFEAEDFVADRARLGRACWRGGRYLEGVAALEPLAGAPAADYWRARCLEKLCRHAEALELYQRVIELAGDSPEGRSAREDREFLEWSLRHGLVGAQ